VGRGEKAKIQAAGVDISNISGVLKTFEVDCGRFPNTQEGLGALLECPLKGWSGPYLDRLPKDPWGQDYQYRYPGTQNQKGFDLWSFGPDGQDGGGDDIDNWTQK
jgi:general secretion pathway protein G